MDVAPADLARIFPGESEMALRMRSFDWANNALGDPRQWPQNLKTSVRIILTSRHPMFVWWGKQLINLYNDGYAAFLWSKHPSALGEPAATVWSEIWDVVGPRAEFAMRQDEGTYDEALPFIMHRKGYAEETYVTFSCSPIPDDDGGFGGILCPVTEETQRIIGERQLALLRELAAKTADARTVEGACTVAAGALATNQQDLPFALIYLLDEKKRSASLAGISGLPRGNNLGPEEIDLDSRGPWPLEDAVSTRQPQVISDLSAWSAELPIARGRYQVREAVAMFVGPPAEGKVAAVVVYGLNPLQAFDYGYRRFLELVTAGISEALTNGYAYEAERRRAEALAELDRTKTAFYSNVSHEFRTPLTLLLGPLEDELRQRSSHRVEIAYRNARRLLKLVNTLLDFSRIEAGRMEAMYQAVDLARFTAELASVFRSGIERAGLRFIVNCPPLGHFVYVDREMWEKIVLNLLSNALKFTFAGEIEICLREENGRAVLTVRDTGVGIPKRELARVFDRFHRIREIRSRAHEGTGIGLALVRELVKLHGGDISVQSAEHSGSTFRVSIPLGPEHLPLERIGAARPLASVASGAIPFIEEAQGWVSGSPNQSPDALPSRHSSSSEIAVNERATVLLADDNADMREYVQRLLTDQYNVIAVADGEAALATARERQPDLVLCDIMMPRLDGYALVERLRGDPRTRSIPILLLSARAGEESRVEGLQQGADDYLIKPFSARELLARVKAHVDARVARKTAEEVLRRGKEDLERRVKDRTVELERANTTLRMEAEERARAQEALGESEKLLASELDAAKTLQSISTELIPEQTPETLYTHVLDAAMELMRADAASIQILERDHTLKLLASKHLHPISAALWEHVSASSETTCGKALATNKRVVVADVETCDFMAGTRDLEEYRRSGLKAMQSTPLASRSGRILGMISTHWREKHHPSNGDFSLFDVLARQTADLIERSRADAVIRESEERFRLFVENVHEYALIEVGPEGCIQSWNPGAERLFGYAGNEVLGRSFSWLVQRDPMQHERLECKTANVSTVRNEEDAQWLTRKDGTRFWARWVSEPIYDENGKLRGVAKVMRDETDRQRTEQETRHSLAEKEELLKEVHHRVKNNLQVISSLVNLQAKRIEDPKLVGAFEETRNRVYSIATIHELLYRSDTLAAIDLADYARKLVPDLIQLYCANERIRADISGEGTLELERAVPYGLLLNELVSNVCKHAFPQGKSGEVRVAFRRENNYIVMAVDDSGVGLPDGFDYKRAESLGLKLVHSLARQLRASIDVHSGDGTRVTVRIPERSEFYPDE